MAVTNMDLLTPLPEVLPNKPICYPGFFLLLLLLLGGGVFRQFSPGLIFIFIFTPESHFWAMP